MVKQTCTLPALSLLLRERERERERERPLTFGHSDPQSILSCPHCLSPSRSRQKREGTPSLGLFSFFGCSTVIFGGLALCFGNLGSYVCILFDECICIQFPCALFVLPASLLNFGEHNMYHVFCCFLQFV